MAWIPGETISPSMPLDDLFFSYTKRKTRNIEMEAEEESLVVHFFLSIEVPQYLLTWLSSLSWNATKTMKSSELGRHQGKNKEFMRDEEEGEETRWEEQSRYRNTYFSIFGLGSNFYYYFSSYSSVEKKKKKNFAVKTSEEGKKERMNPHDDDDSSLRIKRTRKNPKWEYSSGSSITCVRTAETEKETDTELESEGEEEGKKEKRNSMNDSFQVNHHGIICQLILCIICFSLLKFLFLSIMKLPSCWSEERAEREFGMHQIRLIY